MIYNLDMTYQVPKDTSVNTTELKPNQNVIGFAPELISFILSEQKMTTYRYGTKYDYLLVGDEVSIQNSANGTLVARAKILGKHRTTFRDMSISAGSHESYRDKEHQRTVLSGYYAYIGRAINDDDLFLVFDFRLI